MQENILKHIDSAKKITIFSHINVDGDGVGSALALFCYCKNLGKEVCVSIDSVLPANLMWLPDIGAINNNCFYSGDLALVVDCNDKDRIGSKKFKLSKFNKVMQIDHHQDNKMFADYNYVIKQYSSTCEVILDLMVQANKSITPEIALNLLVGILTDTGNLSYNTTTSNTLRKVADLLDKSNLSISYLTERLFSSNSMNIFKLKKIIYPKVKFFNNDEFALIPVSLEDLKQCNVDLADTKSLIEIGLSIQSVKVLVMVTEAEQGVCYVSFRSKGQIDCSKFAEVFGGGGHVNASGCRIYDNLESVINKIKKVVNF